MKSAAIIPSYNVELSIEEVVKRATDHVDMVIVVDDGSIDNTASIAKEGGARVISLNENTGKANATRVGLGKCHDYEAVVTLDGDLQHCPEEIPVLLKGIEDGAHLCIGSRFLNGAVEMPSKNRISNRMASNLMSFITGNRITDPQSGFRALDGEIARDLELKAERYAIEHIMILEAAKKNYLIKEVPISCIYGEEKSQINIISDTFRVSYDILRFMLR